MAVDVRLATPADRDELVRLFHAIDVHYWGEAAPSREAMARHIDAAVLAPGSCEIAIAEQDGRAVGLGTFAVLSPAPGPGGQLFMKDLFTLAAARGQGVGRALLGFLAQQAVERGCVRFNWTAETDQPGGAGMLRPARARAWKISSARCNSRAGGATYPAAARRD